MKLTFFPPVPFAFLVRMNASTSVMGMMASVLVSLTVTALSSVSEPRPHIASQVLAAAVTEDVSFTAVPANMPKASPEAVSKPIRLPKAGNISAASTLKKNMTEIDCATSSSPASMTGAVAAIAEPPQMDEPTPMSVAIFEGICMALCSTNAIRSEAAMVQMIMGRDCTPVWNITLRFMPKPNRTTAH